MHRVYWLRAAQIVPAIGWHDLLIWQTEDLVRLIDAPSVTVPDL